MKILLTGANGQLGQELKKITPKNVELHALSKQELDITDKKAVLSKINTYKPACIINTAAYTAVDEAEKNEDLVFNINAQGAANIAEAAFSNGCRMIHLSTDYLFDGKKGTPYSPDDMPNPLNVYGKSKWAGEKNVLKILPDSSLIIRTSWVYSCYGQNFVKSVLNSLQKNSKINMVSDQIGSPTWTRTLARAIWTAVAKPELKAIYHWCDAGVASKYDLAMSVLEDALQIGIISKAVPICPIKSSDFISLAARPSYSVLDCTKTWKDFNLSPIYWRTSLRTFLQEIKHA